MLPPGPGPKRPDYLVRVRHKEAPEGKPWITVGAAWLTKHPYGDSLSLQLNPGVSLRWDDGLSIILASPDTRRDREERALRKNLAAADLGHPGAPEAGPRSERVDPDDAGGEPL